MAALSCRLVRFGLLAVAMASGSLALQAADPPATIFFPAQSATAQRIEQALNQRTDFQFTDTPLSDALHFLRDYHQVSIWIDQAALQDEGIDPSKKPITLELAGITLRSGFRLMLEPEGLTYLVEDEVLKITTRTVAASRQHTRVYPVGDLAASAEELKSLAEAVENGIGGVKWNRGGNTKLDGSITPVLGTKALVIRQNYSGHEQIVELLTSLRAAQQVNSIEPAKTQP